MILYLIYDTLQTQIQTKTFPHAGIRNTLFFWVNIPKRYSMAISDNKFHSHYIFTKINESKNCCWLFTSTLSCFLLFIFFDKFLLKFDVVECCWCLFKRSCQLICIIWSRNLIGSNKEANWLVNIVWNRWRRNPSYFTLLYTYHQTSQTRFPYYDRNYPADCLVMCCYEYFIWGFDLWPYHKRCKNVYTHIFFNVFSCFIQSMLFFCPGGEDILYFAFFFLSQFHIIYIIISHKSNRMKRRIRVCMSVSK